MNCACSDRSKAQACFWALDKADAWKTIPIGPAASRARTVGTLYLDKPKLGSPYVSAEFRVLKCRRMSNQIYFNRTPSSIGLS
jgi:hypothetical protein